MEVLVRSLVLFGTVILVAKLLRETLRLYDHGVSRATLIHRNRLLQSNTVSYFLVQGKVAAQFNVVVFNEFFNTFQ